MNGYPLLILRQIRAVIGSRVRDPLSLMRSMRLLLI